MKNQNSTEQYKTPYKKGDFIGGKFEVYSVLGKGGFGIVYLVYSHDSGNVYALKTFRDEFIEDKETRERFRREAQIWADLDRHPYIVRAYFVEEINNRIYIGLEFIAPDINSLNSLEGYIQNKQLNMEMILRWSIQFCYGMQFAYSKGIRAHRDIKPSNIMICRDKKIKISDFGLAGILDTLKITSTIKHNLKRKEIGISCKTMKGTGFGTPTYMPPEQFTNATECDERSDIYSFGIVMYQMVTGGKLPFLASFPKDNSLEESRRFWWKMYQLHKESPIPRLDSPIFILIQKCLAKEQKDRFKSFRELRSYLEIILKNINGEVVNVPKSKNFDAWEWNNKGASLFSLGKYDEALVCFNNSLEIDTDSSATWSNKGVALNAMGRFNDANYCYDKAIKLKKIDSNIWLLKGNNLIDFGSLDNALICWERALEINPLNTLALNNIGVTLLRNNKMKEAIKYFNKSLKLNSKDSTIWCNKGDAYLKLHDYNNAVKCYDNTLNIDPLNELALYHMAAILHDRTKFKESIIYLDKFLEINQRDANVWFMKGVNLLELFRIGEALNCFNKSLEIEPENIDCLLRQSVCLLFNKSYKEAIKCFDKILKLNPNNPRILRNKGISLGKLNYIEDALYCLTKSSEIEPENAETWLELGNIYKKMETFEKAIKCFDKCIEIEPKNIDAWFNRGIIQKNIRNFQEAIISFRKVLALCSTHCKSINQIALIYIEKGKYYEAIKLWEKLLHINPKDVNILFNKALAEDKIGQTSKAILSYSEFISLTSSKDIEGIEYAQKRLRFLKSDK